MGKPKNWDKLPRKEKERIAIELFRSLRGQFIVSQALAVAIETLKKVEPPFREESNIEDMEILHEVLFPLYQPEVFRKARNASLASPTSFSGKSCRRLMILMSLNW